MTEKHKRFAEFIVQGKNKGEAASLAGYKGTLASTGTQANRLLKNAEIVAYIKELSDEVRSSTIATAHEVKEGLTRMLKFAEAEGNCAGYAVLATRLAKMDGHDEPEKHELDIEVTIGGNAKN